jgi:hypothetical protein
MHLTPAGIALSVGYVGETGRSFPPRRGTATGTSGSDRGKPLNARETETPIARIRSAQSGVAKTKHLYQ